jgi:preprotein translocase subunit SecD
MKRFRTFAMCFLVMVNCLMVTATLRADAVSKVSLEIRAAETTPAPGLTEVTIEGTNKRVYLHAQAILVKDDVAGASVRPNAGQAPTVEIQLTAEGQKKMARLSQIHRDKPLAILVNGKVVSAPTIRDQITGRDVVLSGHFSKEEAERIARALRTK